MQTTLTQDQRLLILRALGNYFNNSQVGEDKKNIIDIRELFQNIDTIYLPQGGRENPHPTEQKYPLQAKRFREILDEMYQVHLDKNRDYSPMNILATGMVGVATRIWDKTARILSLLGWDMQTGEYSQERKSTNDESIEDNLKDLGVYSIIARLLREGVWGK